ncbi:hypothetical protein A6411_10755 [Prescottella equi]|uniref:hypothetical protein n=1 Tax=Rhodococcus hoagii TaxID=43767 RepID=UPI0009BE5589|nr:hypothetical protein [Prescottella equi]OQQ32278.1 hypothetical protein A6411_10755 [Prescottella equi]
MDPIKAIADITGHVLIRIGNAILGNDTTDQSTGAIHIGEIHIHCDHQGADLDTPVGKGRAWIRGKH